MVTGEKKPKISYTSPRFEAMILFVTLESVDGVGIATDSWSVDTSQSRSSVFKGLSDGEINRFSVSRIDSAGSPFT